MRKHLLVGSLVVAGLVALSSSYSTPRTAHVWQDAPRASTNSGAVKGQVLDAEGQPVSGAEVIALKIDSGMGKVPTAHTDEQGMFLIKRLAPGTYRISISKREDGYPPTDSPFYSAGFLEVPQVTVYEGQTTSDIAVGIGTKAAKLVGRVVDTTTNKLITSQDVQVTLRRIDNPDYSYKTGPDVNGNLTILVPPVPFTIEVSAQGYEKRHLGSLHLSREEIKRLDVSLRRIQ